MEKKDKLCPLSFGFVLRGAAPQMISPKAAKLQIRIGFPCIKEKGVWWDDTIQQCRFITLQMLLEELNLKLKSEQS